MGLGPYGLGGGVMQSVWDTMARRRLLLAASVGLPLVELAILAAVRVPSGVSLAGQASALGPFGAFHDLRWLFVFHDSTISFVWGLVAVLAGRSLLVAGFVWAAWPAEARRPAARTLVVHALLATTVAVVLLSPWVTLLFGAAIVPLSWVFFAAVPAALLTIVLIHHGGVDTAWWRRLPPVRSVGWIGLSFLALSLGALAVAGRPLPEAIIPTVGVGLFNAWAWHHGVRVIVLRLPARQRRSVPATVLAVLVLFGGIVGGASVGFAANVDEGEPAPEPVPDSGLRAVLLVPGFASECCGEGTELRAEYPDLMVEQFSYRGLDADGHPIPHTGSATDADLGHLASLMRAQVSGLASRAGGTVAIVAESEGTLVVLAFLERHPESPVDRVMLLSPILDPGRVTFPDTGSEGRGVVAGYELRALAAFIDQLAPLPLSAEGPLLDSLRREADSLSASAAVSRPGVEQVVVIPLADAVISPVGAESAPDAIVVPALHGGLRGRSDVRAMIATWVNGGDIAGSEAWVVLGRVISRSASAWQVPALGRFAEGGEDLG